MYSSYVPGFSSYLQRIAPEHGAVFDYPIYTDAEPPAAQVEPTQGLPRPLPVQPEPYSDDAPSLGGWSLENFQNQFMRNDGAGALADYIGQQAAAGKNYVSPIGDTVGQTLMPGALNGMLNLYGDTPEEQALRYFNLDARDTRVPITFDPRTYGGGYQLVGKDGSVLGTAASEDELAALVQQAAGIRGAKDVYSIQGQRGNGDVDTIYRQPEKGTLADILKMQALFAAAGGGLSALGVGAGASGATASGAAGAAGGAAGAAAPATGGVLSSATGALGSAAGAIGATAPITVIAPAAGLSTGTLAGALAGAAASGLGAGGGAIAPTNPTPMPSEIVVTGSPAAPTVPGAVLPVAAAPVLGGLAAGAPPVQTPPAATPEEIVVTGSPGSTVPGAAAGIGSAAAAANAAAAASGAGGGGPSAGDILDYVQLGSLALGSLGSLFGGGGRGAGGATIPGGFRSLSPVFSGALPSANLPGLTGSAGGPRPAADLAQQGLRGPQDWYRYGYGPQQSFFNYVPQAQPNTSTAYTGYAEGGSVVEGPGDGREDKIPAMLSDGEYVMDAETVALLGNGSNKAGADMLDQFRVNIRKHKGRELVRGNFSVDAKSPEHYLAGGRA